MADLPEFNNQDIHRLPLAANVRLRPGMYIGDTGQRGLHHLIFELVYNSLEEAHATGCRHITIDLLADGGCRVHDDGQGVPIEVIESRGKRFLELAFTEGGFSTRGVGTYRTGRGLHGCGLVAVNALSCHLLVEVSRDDRLWRQEFARGEATSSLQTGKTIDTTGTSIVLS